jgi:hypothetical protein
VQLSSRKMSTMKPQTPSNTNQSSIKSENALEKEAEQKEKEKAAELAKKSILTAIGLKMEKTIEETYVDNSKDLLQKQDRSAYFDIQSLKTLINREEWYNIPECVRLCIESLIKGV